MSDVSENVIIQEGGKGARMRDVDHILTEDLETGELIPWVPESARKSGIKYVSKNGTYKASDDKLHSWSKVNVGILGGKQGKSAPSESDGGRQVPKGEGKDYIVPAGIGHSVDGYDEYQGSDYTVNVVSGIAIDPITGMQRDGMPVLKYPLRFPLDEYPYYVIYKVECSREAPNYPIRVSSNIQTWETGAYLYYDEGMTQAATFKTNQVTYIEYMSKSPFRHMIGDIGISEEKVLEMPVTTIQDSGIGKYRTVYDFSVSTDFPIPPYMYWNGVEYDEMNGTYVCNEEGLEYSMRLLNSRYRVGRVGYDKEYYVMPDGIYEYDVIMAGVGGIQIGGHWYYSDFAYVDTADNPFVGNDRFVESDGTVLDWKIGVTYGRNVFSSSIRSIYTTSENADSKLIFSTISEDGTLLDKPIEDGVELEAYKLRILT